MSIQVITPTGTQKDRYPALQGTLSSQFFLLLNAVMVVRYIFTFHLKNPVATEHDFWVLFMALWSFNFYLISCFTYAFLPGKNPATNYVCLGKVHKDMSKLFPKINYPLLILFPVTVAINLFCGLRLILFSSSDPISAVETPAGVTTRQQRIQKAKNHMFSISLNFGVALTYSIMSLPTILVSALTFDKIDQFPHYLLVYYFHLCSEPMFICLTITMLFIKNEPLRSFVYRHAANFFGFEG